jgi:hypothetical protein
MSTVFPDRLRIEAQIYAIDSTPLEPYLASLPEQPPRRVSPFSQRGYVATWTIHEGTMYLAEITSQSHALLLAGTGAPGGGLLVQRLHPRVVRRCPLHGLPCPQVPER